MRVDRRRRRAKHGRCPGEQAGKRARAVWPSPAWYRRKLQKIRAEGKRIADTFYNLNGLMRPAWRARPLEGKVVWLDLKGKIRPDGARRGRGAWYSCCPWCWPAKWWDVQRVTPLETDGAVDIVICEKCGRQFPAMSPDVTDEARAALLWTELNRMVVPIIGWRITERGAIYRVPRNFRPSDSREL